MYNSIIIVAYEMCVNAYETKHIEFAQNSHLHFCAQTSQHIQCEQGFSYVSKQHFTTTNFGILGVFYH